MHREDYLELLFQKEFDLLVIGGGATGAGIALDATLRGYKTALIEAADFASGASRAGRRNCCMAAFATLKKLFSTAIGSSSDLFRDSLKERATLMRIAPHLTSTVSIILPVYSQLKKVYYCVLRPQASNIFRFMPARCLQGA